MLSTISFEREELTLISLGSDRPKSRKSGNTIRNSEKRNNPKITKRKNFRTFSQNPMPSKKRKPSPIHTNIQRIWKSRRTIQIKESMAAKIATMVKNKGFFVFGISTPTARNRIEQVQTKPLKKERKLRKKKNPTRKNTRKKKY